jgi:hypothetical protein
MIEVFGPFWRVPLDVLEVRFSRKREFESEENPS